MELSWAMGHLVPVFGFPKSRYHDLVIVTAVNPDNIIVIETIWSKVKGEFPVLS